MEIDWNHGEEEKWSGRKRKALDWKPQGSESGVRTGTSQTGAIEEEDVKGIKTLNEVKKFTEKRRGSVGGSSVMFYVLLGLTAVMTTQCLVTVRQISCVRGGFKLPLTSSSLPLV
jgi:hypothetical protein